MWTSQVYGHHDKMARTKTHRTSQNTGVYKDATDIRDITIFCVFRFLSLCHYKQGGIYTTTSSSSSSSSSSNSSMFA